MSAAFDLIVFDWDGTLADSTGPIVAGMQRAIAALGLPPRDDDAIRALIGLGFRDGLQLLYPDRDPARLEAELLACRESRTKLMQERSEVEEPQEQNLTEGDQPTDPEPATTAAVATRDPEDCS